MCGEAFIMAVNIFLVKSLKINYWQDVADILHYNNY